MKTNTTIDDSFLSNDMLDLYVTFGGDGGKSIEQSPSTSDQRNVSGMSNDSEDHIDWNILNENEESEYLWKEIQALKAEDEEHCYIFDDTAQTFTSIKDHHSYGLSSKKSSKDYHSAFNNHPDSITDEVIPSDDTARKVTNQSVKLVSPIRLDNENMFMFSPLSPGVLASFNESNSPMFQPKEDICSSYHGNTLDYCQKWVNQLTNEKNQAKQNEKCDQYQMIPHTSKRDSNLRKLLNRTDHKIRRTAGEPRRPKNGFIRFSIDCRQQVAKEKPRLDNREISRVLGAKWRKMSAEERKPYEVEFEKDISEIRELNPEWRYAPAKKFAADLVEPMPSRLRPRENLKRNIPPLVRPYKRRKQKRALQSEKKETSDTDSTSTWVQCDLCSKWRRLPKNTDIHKLPRYWFCQQNPDKNYNMCLVPEEVQMGVETSEIGSNRESPCLHNDDIQRGFTDLRLNGIKLEVGAMNGVLFT